MSEPSNNIIRSQCSRLGITYVNINILSSGVLVYAIYSHVDVINDKNSDYNNYYSLIADMHVHYCRCVCHKFLAIHLIN